MNNSFGKTWAIFDWQLQDESSNLNEIIKTCEGIQERGSLDPVDQQANIHELAAMVGELARNLKAVRHDLITTDNKISLLADRVHCNDCGKEFADQEMYDFHDCI